MMISDQFRVKELTQAVVDLYLMCINRRNYVGLYSSPFHLGHKFPQI